MREGKRLLSVNHTIFIHTANEGPVRIPYKCLVPIYVFPEIKLLFLKQNYNVLSPRSFTYISVRDLYISRIGLPILLQETSGPILGIYKSLTDTLMRKSGLRPHNSQKRNTVHKWNFLSSALLLQEERMEKQMKRECHKIFNFTHEGGDQAAQHQPHHFHPLLLQGERMEKHLKRECHKIFNFTHEGGDQVGQRQPHHFDPLLLEEERMETFEERVS
jgi:hypothetical protein